MAIDDCESLESRKVRFASVKDHVSTVLGVRSHKPGKSAIQITLKKALTDRSLKKWPIYIYGLSSSVSPLILAKKA